MTGKLIVERHISTAGLLSSSTTALSRWMPTKPLDRPALRRSRRPRAVIAAAMMLAGPVYGQSADRPADSPAVAEASGQAERPVVFEVGTGVKRDTNVALLELDTSTGTGDTMTLVQFGVGYKRPTTRRFGVAASYAFSQTIHEHFSAFDLGLHLGSGTLSWDFGRLDAGAIVQHARAVVDGDGFMTLTQISPFVSRLVGSKLLLRFSYADARKRYDRSAYRAARADAWSSDVYVFLNGVRTYLLVGHRLDVEDAVESQFDFRGARARVQFSHRIALDARELTFKSGVRLERRDYRGVTPSIGAVRRDRRRQFEASLAVPLGERVVASLSYQRADNESNLRAVDFAETVTAVTFTAEL